MLLRSVQSVSGRTSYTVHPMRREQQALIPVEVAYALPDRQEIIKLNVEQGCTALEAVRRSNIDNHFPEIDLDDAAMGIFSRALDGKLLPTPDVYQLEPMDRVEIYRPLSIDPKQARQTRAAKAAKEQKQEMQKIAAEKQRKRRKDGVRAKKPE